MKSKIQIGAFEFATMITLYIIANDKIRGYYIPKVNQDIFMINIFGFIGSIIVLLSYWWILKRVKSYPFHQTVEILLGKPISKLIFLLFAVYFLFQASLDLRDSTEIVRSFLLDTTPPLIIALAFVLVLYVALINGLEVISRVSVLLFYILMTVFISFSILALTNNKVELSNFMPFFENKTTKIAYYSILTSYSIPFGELVIFLFLFQYLNNEKNKGFKYSIYGQVLGWFILAMVTAYNIAILNPSAMEFTLSPSLRISKRIDVEQFLQRFDLLTIQVLLHGSFIKQVLLLFGSSYCFKQVFNMNSKLLYASVCIISLILSIYFEPNYQLLIKFRFDVIITYMNLMFEIILPAFILFMTFIKRKQLSNLQPLQTP